MLWQHQLCTYPILSSSPLSHLGGPISPSLGIPTRGKYRPLVWYAGPAHSTKVSNICLCFFDHLQALVGYVVRSWEIVHYGPGCHQQGKMRGRQIIPGDLQCRAQTPRSVVAIDPPWVVVKFKGSCSSRSPRSERSAKIMYNHSLTCTLRTGRRQHMGKVERRNKRTQYRSSPTPHV